MATLTGKLVADTYKALLKLIDNDVITGSEKQISDGVGGSTGVFIDTNGFLRASKYKVTGATSSQFLKGDGTLDGTAYLPVGTTTTNVPEGTNLYFTQTRVLNTLLTGFLPVTGVVTATDSVLTAINKIWWNIVNGGGGGGGGYVPYIGALQNVDLGEFGLKTGFVSLDNTPTNTPTTAGTLSWNDTDGTADLKLKGGNVTLQIGQEENVRVVNKTGATLNEADFRAVRIRSVAEGGAQGQRLAVKLAQADNDANSSTTIGLVTESIANNAEGFITTFGNVSEINTTGAKSWGGAETWVDGDMLYLSPDHAGYLTNVKPVAPKHMVVIGYVVYAHAVHGKIFVKVDNGYELNELHNVLITDPVTQDILTYDDAIGGAVWINRNIYTAIGATDVGKGFLSIPNSETLLPPPTRARWTRINVDNTVSAVEALTTGKIPMFSGAELFLESPIYTTGMLVGIGTVSPTALLHLKGTTAYTELKLDNNSPTGGGMFISLQNGVQTALFGADAYYQTNTSIDAAIVSKQVGSGIQFYTNGSQAEKMGINADGNVFIGQTPTWTSSAVNLIVRGKTGAAHIGIMHYDMSIKGIFNTFNSVVQIGSSTYHSVAIMVENSEKGRVNSFGRLLWGTTIDNGVDIAQFNGSIVATAIKKSGGTSSQFLKADGSVDSNTYGTGTVTSVAASVPTGFDIAGSPITSSGTLAITFAAGYSLPTTAKQTQWDTAYSNRITSASLPLSIMANVISITKADSLTDGYLSAADWATFNAKQSALSGVGFVKVVGSTISYDNTSYTPTSRLLTINGTSYDLSTDRSWTITPGSGMRNVQSFTATSGQTTFSVTGGYTVNLVDVYVNGTRLSSADFTATNGTTVVLATGVVTNDIVEIIAYTASLSSGINGSGTTNYVPKFTSSNTLADSLIFSNGNAVGIGTSNVSAEGNLFLGAKGTTEGGQLVLQKGTSQTYAAHLDNYTDQFRIISGTDLASSTVRMAIDLATGAVSIGGSVTANSFVKSGGTASQILAADGSVITAGTNVTISGGVISATGGGGSGSGTTNYIAKWTNSSTLGNASIFDNGNIGINTTNPDFVSSGDKVLTIYGSSTRSTINLVNSSTGTTGVGGSLRGYNGTTYLAGIDLSTDGATNSGAFVFYGNRLGSVAEKFRITSLGNIISAGKIIVQNGTDGGALKGINFWTETDNNWGMYMSQAGAGKSLAGGTACNALDGRYSYAVRSRIYGGNQNSFIWENSFEQGLMSLGGDDGRLWVQNSLRTKMVHLNAASENRGHRIYSRTMDVNSYTTATNMRFTVATGNIVQFQYEVTFHATRTTSGNPAEIWYLKYTAGITYDAVGNPNERWWTYREQDGNGIAGIGRNNQFGYFEIQNAAFDSGCRLTCVVKITCNNWDAVTVTFP